MAFSLDRFRTEVLDGAGLARTNRFEVEIMAPAGLVTRRDDLELASLYVEQANFPLQNIFTKQFKIFGPTYQRPITSEYGGEGIPIVFHVDSDLRIKRLFEDWMHLVVDPYTFTVGYQENYISDIYIRQLDEQNNTVHEVKLIEAFPRNVNLMDLNNASSNQTHRLSVLFAYRYWINTSAERTQAAVIPRQVIFPQIPRNDLSEIPPDVQRWDWTSGELVGGGQGSDIPPGA